MTTQITDITMEQLLAKLDRGEHVALLDVRNEEEYRHWKIEARRPVECTHIPYFDFIEDESSAIGRLPKGPAEVVVVCAKGGSSAMVAELLRQSGISATNLAGGMVAYGEYLEAVQVPLASAENDLFEVWQINRRGKGCLSYMIISDGQAAVIDPSRNTAVYESLARRAEARITHVFETHIHADHVSGGPQLASAHAASYSVQA